MISNQLGVGVKLIEDRIQDHSKEISDAVID